VKVKGKGGVEGEGKKGGEQEGKRKKGSGEEN
jgi:hypothetical protein